MKYLITKVVCNKPKICLRKRLLHKGYQLLTNCEYDIQYKHLVYVDTLKQAENYIYNEYNVTVKL